MARDVLNCRKLASNHEKIMPANNEPTSPSKPLRFGPEINPAESSPSLKVPPPSVLANPIAPTRPESTTTPLPAYEFLGYLPDSYGTRKLFLVPRDPRILFAYWDLSPVQYQESARVAKDGKIFLEIYVPGEGRVQQVHIWDSHKNWYLQVNRPDTAFLAQIGFYRPDGGFEVLARSGEVRTPRDTLSPNTEARFITIPFHVPFQEIRDAIAAQALPGEEIGDTLARLQQSDLPVPLQARLPRDLTAKESEELLGQLDGDEVRRRMVGSFEITEILRKRYETALSSGQWTSSAWVTSVSSPFGSSFGRERGFHMHVNAELIIYGGTEPDAKVRIDGHDIVLGPDGTFSYHFVFPDGRFHVPVEAKSADGVETRSALLSFLRLTELEGDVRKTAQPSIDEPLGRQA
jgi:hypothetical protein